MSHDIWIGKDIWDKIPDSQEIKTEIGKWSYIKR